MKKVIVLVTTGLAIFLLSGLVPSMAGAAEKSSSSKIVHDISAIEFMEIAKKNNMECELKTLKNGKPLVIVRTMGLLSAPINVHFYDKNEKDRYSSLGFVLYFDTGNAFSRPELLRKVNEHNKDKRFMRMSVGDDNSVCIDRDLDLMGGITTTAVEEALMFFGKSAVLYTFSFLK